MKYLKMSLDKITDYEVHEGEMFVIPDEVAKIGLFAFIGASELDYIYIAIYNSIINNYRV